MFTTCRLRRLIAACGLMVIAFAGSPGSASATGDRDWHITDLGLLSGATSSSAASVNDRGEVAGESGSALFMHAFLWRNGHMTDLGTLGTFSRATAVNDRTEVVGFSNTGVANHAFLWRNGRMRDLGTLGGSDSFAAAINDRGEVAGYSFTPDGSLHAFLWRDGIMRDLGTFNGGSSLARGVNEWGQVAGDSTIDGMNSVPVLWQDHAIQVLDTQFASGNAINDQGQVAGRRFNDGAGFIWQDGRAPIPLVGPSGTPVFTAQVNAINNRAQVVGALEMDAFVWQAGRFTILPGLDGASLASDINNRGQIAGQVGMATGPRAVLWTR